MGSYIEIYCEEFDFNRKATLEQGISDEDAIQLENVGYEKGQLLYIEKQI
jgi:hypothetical protein